MITTATGPHTSRSYGTYVRKRSEPRVTTKFGTSAVNCFCACTVSRPSVIVEIPSVMISALTRKRAIPMPLTSPIPSPTASASAIASAEPCVPKREMTNAPVVAVVATDRSTPPVSMTSV